MSYEIEKAYSIAFDTNFRHLAQQKGSRLAGLVQVETGVMGRAKDFNLIGATAARKKTSRNTPTPIVNTPHGKRRCFLETHQWGDTVEGADKVRMLNTPESEYLRAGINSMGRSKDDIIIAAALGNSVSVTVAADSTDSLTNIALPASQKIAHGSAGLTLAKLLTMKEIIDGNEVDPECERYCLVTAKQITNLFNATEVKSVDYNTVKSLSEGKLDTYLGFKFIRTERLTKDSNGHRQVIGFCKDGIGMAIGADIMTRLGERSDLSFAVQLYAEMDLGAVRIEEKMVVEIACVES